MQCGVVRCGVSPFHAVPCSAVLPPASQTKDQPELTVPSPEVCQHLGPQLAGAAAVVLSQLLASYLEGVDENTFLTADSSVFSSSAGGPGTASFLRSREDL